MKEIDVLLSTPGSSVAGEVLGPVAIPMGTMELVAYFSNSTIATTQSIRLDTAPDSTGPWVPEASTSISTVGSTSGRFRVTGPCPWVRMVYQTASTGGNYQVRLIGVS